MKVSECKLFYKTDIELDKFTIKSFSNGEIIADEGNHSDKLGIILTGRVHVKAYTSGGKNFTVNTLDEGDMFGDMLLFSTDFSTYPGSLISQGETIILYIKNREFKKLLFSNQQLCTNFLKILSNKALNVTMKSKLLSQDSLRDKILFYLVQQQKRQKSDTIQLNMTKEELANLLYTQRPSLSRELRNMKDDGLIDYDRYSITLK